MDTAGADSFQAFKPCHSKTLAAALLVIATAVTVLASANGAAGAEQAESA